jgi:4-hydroxy-tetrahydrodipicolinate synthase
MVDFALNNNFAEARKIHQKYFELFKGLFTEGNPVGVKAAMELLGRDSGELRLPLYHLSAANTEALKQLLSKTGAL